MEAITSDFLESSVYRVIFEYLKYTKNLDQVLGLVNDIYALPNRNLLIYQIISIKKNSLDLFWERNKSVLKSLEEYDLDVYRSSFLCKLIMNDDILKILNQLRDNISLLDLYLENAKRIESLKVERIVFGDLKKLMKEFQHYYCEVKKQNDRELKSIRKCYTDGRVRPVLTGEEARCFNWCHNGYNFIPFDIFDNQDFSFVLTCENEGNGRQRRTIEIENFAFDASKLPTEDDIRSYKLSKELVRKNDSLVEID